MPTSSALTDTLKILCEWTPGLDARVRAQVRVRTRVRAQARVRTRVQG